MVNLNKIGVSQLKGRGGGGVTRSESMSTASGEGEGEGEGEGSPSEVKGKVIGGRLSHVSGDGDEAGSEEPIVVKKKKRRAQRSQPGDKNGRGLRQFSMRVCEKVESKVRTTYNEVADELVNEFADSDTLQTPDQIQYDEKNIRRRVYDALNVLMAMDIIAKDKKEIHWRGLPHTSPSDVEELKDERIVLKSRIEKKAAYLRDLEEQYVGFQNLIQRNEQLYASGNPPTGGVALPFILVQTRPHATVEVEISEDMQLVHFDFNSTPFELHDDNYVLKAMRLSGTPECDESDTNDDASLDMYGTSQPQPTLQPLNSETAGKPPTGPPLPGILKARVKNER